jgi:hypothetical protein
LRALARRGHAIGCHGLDHGAWEDYRRLDRRRPAPRCAPRPIASNVLSRCGRSCSAARA